MTGFRSLLLAPIHFFISSFYRRAKTGKIDICGRHNSGLGEGSSREADGGKCTSRTADEGNLQFSGFCNSRRSVCKIMV